jgi:hypothetical protein
VIFSPGDDGGWSVTVTKLELKALAAHASKDDTRPHINGICLQPTDMRVCATDGHRIAAVTAFGVEGIVADAVIVPLAAIKAMLRQPHAEWVLWPDGRAEAGGKDDASSVTFKPVDAKFPPVEQILKYDVRPNPGPAFGLNVKYLADLKLVVDAANFDGKGEPSVAVCPPVEPLDPIVFFTGKWQVVLMPLRCDAADKACARAAKTARAA